MKTAQRILLTALAMFNEHGENAVTSVDIAIELDISPGNLYYHFKGKESLVSALMKMHEQQMQPLLRREKLDTLHAQEIMYYLYMLVDSIHVFRFFYKSPADLAEKYPAIIRPRKHILKSLNDQLGFLFDSLATRKVLSATKDERRLLVDLMSLIITQSCQFDELNSHMDSTMQRYHALSLVKVSLLPRLLLSDDERAQLENALSSYSLARNFTSPSPLEFAEKV
ncbi:hypothetical protein D210916BOD24_10200 [Alteromonas sp. D210916BOD_24]|uniref:TetR/AcrR family transcriptional regulator n=1 Tax=Alteromonas sp. D210916BOD_24 TaxID=3157618 RepID=UPI00399CE980